MKEPKTPQAKKRLSLLKDCQNTYGEHDKSSRTAIRWRKSWVNRSYRRDIKQSLDEGERDFDDIADRVKTIEPHHWRKCADMPLGEKLHRDKTWEVFQKLIAMAANDPQWLDRLARYLCDRDLKSGRVAILVRRVRAFALDRNSVELDFTEDDLNLVAGFLSQ